MPDDLRSPPACCYCRAVDVELRPYGPGGAYACAPCTTLDENAAEAERQRRGQLEAAGQLSLLGGLDG